MFTYEEDIPNYLGFNINKNSVGTFELLLLHLVEKIINHFVLTVSASLNSREKPAVKTLLYKDEYSLGRKYVWNYRALVGMLSYIQGSTQT